MVPARKLPRWKKWMTFFLTIVNGKQLNLGYRYLSIKQNKCITTHKARKKQDAESLTPVS